MNQSNQLDIAIATSLNNQLKHCVSTMALSACESVAPQVRQAYLQGIQDCVAHQEQLSHLMQQKGWYIPPKAEKATIQTIMPQVQSMLQAVQGLQAGGQGVQAGAPGLQAGGRGVQAGAANPGNAPGVTPAPRLF